MEKIFSMSTIRITKQFNFETGHALYGYDGKCRNVHGHSYKLSVTVSGTPIDDSSHVKFGMVIDFTDLKKIVKGHFEGNLAGGAALPVTGEPLGASHNPPPLEI